MTDPEHSVRFDELDAARALADISAAEHAEWTRLVEEHGFTPDDQLDALVVGLDSSLAPGSAVLPPALVKRLEADMVPFTPLTAEIPRVETAEVIPFWRHPALGWAAAACFAVILLVPAAKTTIEASPTEQRQALLQSGEGIQLSFAGTADFENLQGDVIWTDETQTGFMRFNGLPANDPTVAQYQLWIVDPERDERPVDGGVFDIPSDGGDTIVPIRAALRVDGPVAFVVTVEQPGGVVVSKQEIVAAIAQQG